MRPERRTKRRRTLGAPVGRSSFKFDDEAIISLRSAGLSGESIAQLEDDTWRELCLLIDGRNRTSSRNRRNQLKKLLSYTKVLSQHLREIDSYTDRLHPDFASVRYLFRLNVDDFTQAISTILESKGRAGNVETDLDVLAYKVAKIMLLDGLEVRRDGKVFLDVLHIVWQSIGEEPSSIPAAIKKACTEKGTELPNLTNPVAWRRFTIPELIERGGIDAYADDDCPNEPHN